MAKVQKNTCSRRGSPLTEPTALAGRIDQNVLGAKGTSLFQGWRITMAQRPGVARNLNALAMASKVLNLLPSGSARIEEIEKELRLILYQVSRRP